MTDVTEIPRDELRAVVEQMSAARGDLARQKREALASVTTQAEAPSTREALWQLRPTWAWVWLAETADPATWARAVRWARQIAARRSDPTPLARLLGRFAARRVVECAP